MPKHCEYIAVVFVGFVFIIVDVVFIIHFIQSYFVSDGIMNLSIINKVRMFMPSEKMDTNINLSQSFFEWVLWRSENTHNWFNV